MLNPTSQVGAAQVGAAQLGGVPPSGLIVPSTIPSGEAWFAPLIIGGSNSVVVGVIPSGEAWPTPVVSGPVTCGTIPSGEAWPAPSLTQPQIIEVGVPSPFVEAIPSGETWFPPRVANVQTISVSPIPSGEHWFTPVVTGSPLWINTAPIASGERWYIPTVTGGASGVRLFLSGIEVTEPYFSWIDNTCRITSQTLGRWSANFDLYVDDGSYIPVIGQTVLIMDNGVRIFAGCIQEVVAARQLSTVSKITYTCSATDKSAICDHRVVVGKTYSATDALGNFTISVQSVILDIVTNFLAGEGIVPNGVPATLGNLSSDLNWNFPTVTQAFDQICQNEGLVWWVDAFGVLYFSPYDTLPPAPFGLTETSYNWRNLTVQHSTTAYYNKLYAVSNLNILPGSGSGGGSGGGQTGNTESFTFTVGQPGIAFITLGDGTKRATGLNVSVGISAVLSMTVNGAPQTVYDITQYTGQTRTGPNDYLWVYGPGNTTLSPTYQPPAGASIVVDYVPTTSSASSAQYGSALNPVNPSGDPLGTCGSGVYEGVLQVQNVSSQADLNAIAQAQLDRIKGIPTIVKFQSDFPGLAPGQLMSVFIPLTGASDGNSPLSLMITSVSGVFIPPGPFPATGGSFRWDVETNSNLDPGNWFKWFERLVGATANPLPVLQYEQATFILGSGSNVAGGTAITNPYPVGRTGKLVSILIVAANVPADQDLIATITDNNVPIGSVKLPSSAAPNQSFTYNPPATSPIYVYAGDNLNINLDYAVTGSSPVPAANVTVAARWAS